MTKKKPPKSHEKELPESDIIGMMRDQLGRKLTTTASQFKMPTFFTKSKGAEGKSPGTVVSRGLKLRRKDDNALVTVDSVGDHSVVVEMPNGELYNISKTDLDEKFELD